MLAQKRLMTVQHDIVQCILSLRQCHQTGFKVQILQVLHSAILAFKTSCLASSTYRQALSSFAFPVMVILCPMYLCEICMQRHCTGSGLVTLYVHSGLDIASGANRINLVQTSTTSHAKDPRLSLLLPR